MSNPELPSPISPQCAPVDVLGHCDHVHLTVDCHAVHPCIPSANPSTSSAVSLLPQNTVALKPLEIFCCPLGNIKPSVPPLLCDYCTSIHRCASESRQFTAQPDIFISVTSASLTIAGISGSDVLSSCLRGLNLSAWVQIGFHLPTV